MKFTTGKPNIIDRPGLLKKLDKILDRGILTNNGPVVKELEDRFETLFGVPGLCYANATLALEALLKVTHKGLTEYLVHTPSFSFVATSSAIKEARRGIKFVDINTFYQQEPLEFKLPYSTSLLVNLFGSCGELKDNAYYDNAHAIGVKYKDKPIAQFGRASVYSLHSTKFINGIEGGIIATQDKELLDNLKSFRNFGYSNFSTKAFSGEVVRSGTNAKMSELHAAVALHHLHYLDFLIGINKERYDWYQELLPPQAHLIKYPQYVSPNYSYIVIRVPENRRDELCQYLLDHKVFVRQYFMPIHLMPPYIEKKAISLPNTEQYSRQVLALPQGIQLKRKEDVMEICFLIRDFFKDKR